MHRAPSHESPLVGDFVDGFGILATVISLVTNLGIGALVLVSGICYLPLALQKLGKAPSEVLMASFV
jgi:choline-glycine betaine transporter